MLLSIRLSQFSNPSFLFEWIPTRWFSVEGQYDIVLLHAKMKLYLVHRCKYSTFPVRLRLLTAVGRSAL